MCVWKNNNFRLEITINGFHLSLSPLLLYTIGKYTEAKLANLIDSQKGISKERRKGSPYEFTIH